MGVDEDQYEQLAEIARRQGRKLASVVRESIVRYCIEPEVERRKRDALDGLLALEPTPVPRDYAAWEAEYASRKGGGEGAAHDRRSVSQAPSLKRRRPRR